MENSGVTCNVCECAHNIGCNKCDMPKIEITKNTSGESDVETPHFCGCFEEK